MARPKGSKNKQDEPISPIPDIVQFTGIARSVECVIQQGYNNFYLVTLHIEDGLVKKKEVSDPYVSFEAIARLEVQCHEATLSLNHNYKNGKAWTK